ncbi:hypothetical protein BJ912DRAFT_1151036 [Pholiota molesta]|nr:hypothetical protein BJ912DRAFT_1151036 [Pholiota molesta]
MRRLALHASALSDAEYDLYTASLRDLSLTDEDDGKASKDGEDAYFENIVVGVREARAWLRGRYSHVPAPTIDGILRLFSPTLAHGDTLCGSEFFAALRLVVHAESGREVDRSLAFVQADPSSASGRPTPSQLQPRSSPPSQASSPSKRHADLPPPAPSRRPPSDMASSKSEPGSHNPFASSDLQSQPRTQPPLHPSQRSESSRSQNGSHNPFVARAPPPPQSEDGNAKLPPLPPRKPAPPIPSSSSSTAPPPPPRRHSRPDRSLSPSKLPSPPTARLNGPPPPPPKLPQHVTSTLMRESLHASKIAQSMKRAEEHLEKERVMQVLKSSSATSSTGGTTSQHASYTYPVRRTASPVRARGYDMSSASSASGSLERGAPPLPRRRHAQQQQPSPPMSASSLEQVALAAPPPPSSSNAYKHDERDRGTEPTAYTLSPFRSPIDPISTSVPPTTDRPSDDGEYSPVRSAPPPPTHPDRKPFLGPGYSAPSAFEAIYGPMASSPSPSPYTPTPNGTGLPAPAERARSARGRGPPPLVRRRRPESVQVLGSVGSLVQAFEPAGLSRHASLARPAGGVGGGSAHRRSSLSMSSTPPTRDVSPTRQTITSQSQSHAGAGHSPLSSLQRTFAFATTLQPRLDALAPRLDKARYKAEAGLSRRGFIPSSGGSSAHGGVGGGGGGGGAGREEKEGLMRAGAGDALRRGRKGTAGSDAGDGSDAPEVDGARSEDEGDEDEDTAWQRSRGMRRGAQGEAQARGRGAASGRARNVFDDEYDRDGGALGTEQDNLKWPAGEGWAPL